MCLQVENEWTLRMHGEILPLWEGVLLLLSIALIFRLKQSPWVGSVWCLGGSIIMFLLLHILSL